MDIDAEIDSLEDEMIKYENISKRIDSLEDTKKSLEDNMELYTIPSAPTGKLNFKPNFKRIIPSAPTGKPVFTGGKYKKTKRDIKKTKKISKRQKEISKKDKNSKIKDKNIKFFIIH